MALTNRRKETKVNSTLTTNESDSSDKSKKRNNASSKVLQLLCAFMVVLAVCLLYVGPRLGNHLRSNGTSKWVDIDNGDENGASNTIGAGIDAAGIDGESIKVSFKWRSSIVGDNELIELGPHTVEIAAKCKDGIVYAHISKDALVDVPLVEIRPMHWVGTFSVPIQGEYDFNVKGNGCDGNKDQIVKTVQSFKAVGHTQDSASERKGTLMDDIISKGAWISSKKLSIKSEPDESKPDYVWVNPTAVSRDKKQELESIKGAGANVFKEGSVTDENQFFSFNKLSNYELVCFFGSKSAKDIHESLLSIRRTLFPHQRPFKFHYYEVLDFSNPDETWTDQVKRTFRKCKHVLVSIDEPKNAVSQSEYKSKITTLIKHLTIAFDDETFPLWIFTSMEPVMNTKNCHSPVGNRSTEHPCNAVLKELFSHSPFTSRVRLLDNTPLTNPQLDGLQEDILAAVALRIFIIVGYQVKEWRANGQVGHINGLTKGGKEYPNFELVPYDFSGKLIEK